MVGTATKSSGQSTQPMSKNRPHPQRDRSETERGAGWPGVFVRVLVSVLVVWHLTAVFLAALSVPPTSMLVADIAHGHRSPVRWYLDVLYLHHGHYFFAPEVGPGHLIRYELVDERGSVIERGELPDRKEHWPRLRYHRHLMLADQADLPVPDRRLRERWQRQFLESYAQYLLRHHEDAQSVRLRRLAHYPLPPDLALEGRKLDDPEGYQTLTEVVQYRRDLRPETTDQTHLWQGMAPQIGTRPDPVGGWSGGVR